MSGMVAGGLARGTDPGECQMRHVDLEAASCTDGLDGRDDDRIVGRQLPGTGADAAVEVRVLGGRQDVELLAPIGSMAVADHAELLEDVERSVDGRRDRVRIARATTVDELRPGDVAVDLGQHLDEDPPLGRPAQSLGTKLIGDAGPRAAKVRFPVGR